MMPSFTFLVEPTFFVLAPLCLKLVEAATMSAKFMANLAGWPHISFLTSVDKRLLSDGEHGHGA